MSALQGAGSGAAGYALKFDRSSEIWNTDESGPDPSPAEHPLRVFVRAENQSPGPACWSVRQVSTLRRAPQNPFGTGRVALTDCPLADIAERISVAEPKEIGRKTVVSSAR